MNDMQYEREAYEICRGCGVHLAYRRLEVVGVMVEVPFDDVIS